MFGYGRYEAVDVALKYLYDSKEIYDIHGDTFQITGDDITYRIKLTKRYFGKWKVNSAGWEDLENDSITEINKVFTPHFI